MIVGHSPLLLQWRVISVGRSWRFVAAVEKKRILIGVRNKVHSGDCFFPGPPPCTFLLPPDRSVPERAGLAYIPDGTPIRLPRRPGTTKFRPTSPPYSSIRSYAVGVRSPLYLHRTVSPFFCIRS